MNFVVSWLLKFVQFKHEGQIIQNEVDAFYLLIHIMIEHQWRDVYKEGMIKIIKMQKLVRFSTEIEYPEVFGHLMKLYK